MEKIDKQFIELHKVSVLRSDRFILDDINLSIASDENVAIIGPNGSGKSTFIKLITSDIYPSYTGDDTVCRLFGKDKWSVNDLRQTLGIVTNELQYRFQSDITGFETVLSGFFSSVGIARNHAVTREMEKKAHDMIAFLEVGHLSSKKINTMSSGEARRFLIARALVNEPKVLVLDEPSNSLDISSALKLHAVMRKIAHAGTKIILVTHLVSDIIPEMNRFIFFKEGKVFADGSRSEVFTGEKLSELFDMNVQLTQKDGVCWLNGL